MSDKSRYTRELAGRAPVIPVIVVKDAAHAVPMAEALVAGGLPALEVTLRTPQALDAIRAMRGVKGGIVGAGTVLNHADAKAAKEAGAQFAVSPGATDEVISACEDVGLPLLPGVATPSEAMACLARGYDMLKFFPAAANGGAPVLKAWAGPLPQISFCPTGGVSLQNAGDYLSLPNVVCVGGSWVIPSDAVSAGDWALVEKTAREASQLPR
jgi:2-dehydro-3-deoxyphosphogluconate aldolase/(4S)-4-hydroxy-2-oxoglutarate aldolase